MNLNTRKDCLVNMYNQMQQDLVALEFNIVVLEKEQQFSVAINPEMTRQLHQWTQQIEKLKGSLRILLNMITEEENKNLPKEDTSN